MHRHTVWDYCTGFSQIEEANREIGKTFYNRIRQLSVLINRDYS
ncbi:hypothetical protein PG_0888 [Porphyromonas gingivalis W83]|uniref:Uncharacterized protein n=1 Tax=Porphyromonas gingivalis (strain ATCC BAA-308 / W83) TaxID=242619 RepID=Q7MVY3_PORGI|nr:hypothetical protein PG_0888 [Porphyromonas gingivalis W83]EIW93206.1 hypothetical protein HMPREF1322_1968 [Porphyromonas gingivalis W50]ERJ81258.1 hypothetical protein HMPREF1988_02060 [Porphyromonas gingivalis F0185]ERJ83027.1 hypothetical protein HMPREF1989_02069 [Porphyromonas gingivalis F0566]